MKRFCLLLVFFLLNSVLAQDFNIEYKSFLLQPHFKSKQIQSLTIQESSDSLFKSRTVQYRLEFDTLGRLISIFDYYFDTDTIPERMITYLYTDDSPFYSSKVYHYVDEKGNVTLKKNWLIHFDFLSNTLKEEFLNKKEKYRTNELIFNQSMQILSRKVQAFVVTLNTFFTYSKEGLLKQVRLVKNNPTVKKMKTLELNHYLQYNLHQKIMTTEQWLGERNKQINEYYFNYRGINIKAKVGWRLMNWSNDDKKVIERTNFKYDKTGLLILADYFTERQVSNVHKYTKFDYEFFDNAKMVRRSSDRFTMLWFTDLFAENLIHP